MGLPVNFNKQKVVILSIFLGILLLALFESTMMTAESESKSIIDSGSELSGSKESTKSFELHGVHVKILKEGDCSKKAKNGDMLKMHYTGTFEDGSQFDSSVGRSPFALKLGNGEVIAGWEKGLVGICLGEKRRLWIPYSMGYGESGTRGIPARANLIFETECVDIIEE
eukprot:TRINITY_DN1186_c0_g1_i1.p1 TRINITY_DN1186_c0_g1~~TRINITY_DN1186_c0_g1_i1.p1  ORF type:complete len:169 (+),score=43.80 TRINITY_DN1186_c0_g1_i1:129-635(+)